MTEAVYIVTIRNGGDERVLSASEVQSILDNAASKWAPDIAVFIDVEET